MNCTDMTFGIGGQAMAVAVMLSERDPDFADHHKDVGYRVHLRTTPWYNGRERGVLITVAHPGGPGGHIAVFEHRNSDCICAVTWAEVEVDLMGPPPTIDNVPPGIYESKWDAKEIAGYGEIGKAVEWVYNQMGVLYRLGKEETGE